jgi:anti-sigma factor RsiW
MNSFERPNPSDEALWRALADRRGAPSGSCPSPLELAAYLDGRLDDAARDAVEAHLADCAACLTAVREVRRLQVETAETTPLVAPSVLEAAKALVKAPARRDRADRWRLTDWLAISRWPVAAAVSLAICLVGYRLGTGLAGGDGPAQSEIAAAMSFGTFGTAESDDEIALLFATSLEEDTP